MSARDCTVYTPSLGRQMQNRTQDKLFKHTHMCLLCIGQWLQAPNMQVSFLCFLLCKTQKLKKVGKLQQGCEVRNLKRIPTSIRKLLWATF